MNNSITLKEAIDLKRTYGRLLSHAEQLGTECLTAELTTQFLVDNKSSGLANTVMKDFLPITDAYGSSNPIWKQGKYPSRSSMNLLGRLFLTDLLKPLSFMTRQKRPLG